MKYYLIIGYQLLEKYRKFPTVRVRLNGQLVDEFLCDNEQTTEISVQRRFSKNMSGTCHNWKWDSTETSKFMTPAKYKMIELDATSWPDKGELTIEVSNNNSNYNNGFMTLRSIVWITPVILIRKDIHDNINNTLVLELVLLLVLSASASASTSIRIRNGIHINHARIITST